MNLKITIIYWISCYFSHFLKKKLNGIIKFFSFQYSFCSPLYSATRGGRTIRPTGEAPGPPSPKLAGVLAVPMKSAGIDTTKPSTVWLCSEKLIELFFFYFILRNVAPLITAQTTSAPLSSELYDQATFTTTDGQHQHGGQPGLYRIARKAAISKAGHWAVFT